MEKTSYRITRNEFSILIGNCLDHLDTALYALLAPKMGAIFFPHHDPIVQIILAYSIFATSLVTRPLGALIFGSIARHRGPLIGLSYSLIGMSIPTVAFGFLPGFETLGFWAPVSLLFIRMVRGVFASGEQTIARLYILEGKPEITAKKMACDYQTSSMIGMVLASLMATLILLDDQTQFYWRLCFCLGGSVGLVGFFLRQTSNEETYEKSDQKADQKSAQQSYKAKGFSFRSNQLSNRFLNQLSNQLLIQSIWIEKINIIRISVASFFSHVTYSIPFVFLNSFVPLVTNITEQTMLALNTLLLVFDMLLLPIMGRLLIHLKPRIVMQTACYSLLLTIIPLFVLLPAASFGYVTGLRLWIVFWGVVFLCPLNVWFKELLLSSDQKIDQHQNQNQNEHSNQYQNQYHNQYLVVGIGNAIGSALGRVIPAICLWIWYFSGKVMMPAVFVAICAIIMLWALKRTSNIMVPIRENALASTP